MDGRLPRGLKVWDLTDFVNLCKEIVKPPSVRRLSSYPGGLPHGLVQAVPHLTPLLWVSVWGEGICLRLRSAWQFAFPVFIGIGLSVWSEWQVKILEINVFKGGVCVWCFSEGSRDWPRATVSSAQEAITCLPWYRIPHLHFLLKVSKSNLQVSLWVEVTQMWPLLLSH